MPLQPVVAATDEATLLATELFTELATGARLDVTDEVVVPEHAPRLDHALPQAQPTPGS